VFAARYELNSYIVFRKRLVSRRLRSCECLIAAGGAVTEMSLSYRRVHGTHKMPCLDLT
jgi:hypothetical protein